MGLWDSIKSIFTGAPPPPPPPEWKYVDEREWTARLVDCNDSTLQVFADWLEERGDTRHHLLHLFPTTNDFHAFIETNAESMLGAPLAKRRREKTLGANRSLFELSWDRGLLRGVSARAAERPWDDLALFFRQPISRSVTSLSVTASMEVPAFDDRSLDVLELHGKQLTSLVLGDFIYPDECELSWATVGELQALWRLVPSLKKLHLRGVISTLGAIVAPKLTHLTIETTGLGRSNLEELAAARFPELTHLEVWFGAEDQGCNCETNDLHPLLTKSMPSLRTLGIVNFIATDEIVDRILTGPLLPQLARLDLSKGCLSDGGAQLLLQNASKLAHLEELDLSSNALSETQLAALSELCPSVNVANQRLDEMDDDLRYVAVSE